MGQINLIITCVLLVILIIVYFRILKKKRHGRELYAKAKMEIKSGKSGEAINTLKDALWKFNEEPKIEKIIIAELSQLYKSQQIPFEEKDYLILINQFQSLSKKGSNRSVDEILKVQKLKRRSLERMPELIKRKSNPEYSETFIESDELSNVSGTSIVNETSDGESNLEIYTKCPACGYSLPQDYSSCPDCGILLR
jgi:hypothetical protein